MRHTPGPWARSGLDERLIGPTRVITAYKTDIPQFQAVCRIHDRAAGEADGNAALIAAAPDLLAALGQLVRAIKYTSGVSLDFALDAAVAAMAKAEGQS